MRARFLQKSNNVNSYFKDISAVIFDFDGTLYDKRFFVFFIIVYNFKHLIKLIKTRYFYKKMKNKIFNNRTDFYDYYFNLCGKNKEEYRAWYFNLFLPSLVKILKKHYTPYNGVKNFVEKLNKNNIKCFILSDYPFVQERLDALGMEKSLFADFFSSDLFGALKPSSVSFCEIARLNNINKKNILVVGDSRKADGTGALNADMKFIEITYKKSIPNRNIYNWDILAKIKIIYEPL